MTTWETTFRLPLEYNTRKQTIATNIVNELELVQAATEQTPSIYEAMIGPTTTFGKEMVKQLSRHYTTDTDFLRDTQRVLETWKDESLVQDDFRDIRAMWSDIRGETSFCEKYLFLQWDFVKFLNHSPLFLQLMSVYNVASPLISLFLPVFVLIAPFIIIKMQGMTITFQQYVYILKMLVAHHAITKVFTSFHEVDLTQKVYLVFSAAFYVFSIYQNILVCIRFYSNYKRILDYLQQCRSYLQTSLEKMRQFSSAVEGFGSYHAFRSDMQTHIERLSVFLAELGTVGHQVGQVGHTLWCFYQLYDNPSLHDSMTYSFGFHGYMDILRGLQTRIAEGKMNAATFHGVENQQCEFKQLCYPICETEAVPNDCRLSNGSMIVTGPNASGKTTLLKAVLINVLFTQQFGCGFYGVCHLTPFDHLHCYINIPDTSSRDSLFQAEARRCKEILDTVQAKSDERHLCVFDELYSGTNPEEAVSSAHAFLTYLQKYGKVRFLLTTHYVKLCKKLQKKTKVRNFHMKTVEQEKGTLQYTYQLERGISTVKGGVKVLRDMHYPKEILEKVYSLT